MSEIMGVLFLAGIIIFASHFVKGATGFANALIAIPLLTLFLDIKFVVPMFLLFDFPSSGMIAYQNKKCIQWDTVFLILPGLILGTLIGVYLLFSLASKTLKMIFGIIILLFAIRLILKDHHDLHHQPKKAWGALAGLLGGFTGGMLGMDGPIIVMYLSTQLRKTPFRATLTTIFLLSAIWRGSLYLYGGLFTLEVVGYAIAMIPFLVVGILVGSRFQNRLGQHTFNVIVGCILAVAGILLMVR